MRKYVANILVILLLILFIYPQFSCTSKIDSGKYSSSDSGKMRYPDTMHLLNWNVAFTPSSAGSSADIIQALEDTLIKWVQDRNPDTRLLFIIKYCPCDSLITNLDAAVIYGSGNPVSPPPTQPKPGPTGDYAVGNNNFDVHIPEYKDSNNINYNLTTLYKFNHPLNALPASSNLHRLLAVIDTGLDTPLFKRAFPSWVWGGNLLWKDPTNETTLFNLVPGEDSSVLKDSNPVKHGTSATEVILTQLVELRSAQIPQIMSIRAFDDKEQGTIYTVACALSYAIQHHANFINASWGYFGKEDPVLKKYLQKASDSSIRIIAAAGNTPGIHDPQMICNGIINNLNNLERLKSSDSLFYPACFAPSIENLVSVTQLQQASIGAAGADTLVPCYYQNSSSDYITTGAYEKHSAPGKCCEFAIPFLMQPIEGSSFATPVMTAYFMSVLQGNNITIKSLIGSNPIRTQTKRFTFNGNYYTFSQR